MTLEQLIAKVEAEINPLGFSWLLRSDEAGFYFANITDALGGNGCPAIADTPHEALERSLKLYQATTGRNLKTAKSLGFQTN